MQTVQYPGVKLSQVDTTPAFALGTIVTVPVKLVDYKVDGTTAQTHTGFSTARYVKAVAALTAELVYYIDIDYIAGEQAATGSAVAVNETNSLGKHILLGVPTVDIAAGSYGWVVVSDLVKVAVLASAVRFVPLYVTTTTGKIDDAGTTPIQNIHLLSTASAAAQSKVGRISGELKIGA